MTKARLLACPGCARHVRVNEPACIFCGFALPKSFADKPALPRPPRMNRAGLFAYAGVLAAASTAAVATSSCGGTLEAGSSEAGSQDGTSDTWQPGDEGVVALYGGAFFDAPGDAGLPDGDFGDASAYGLPADAYEPNDGDFGTDAAYGGAADSYVPPDAKEPDVVVAPPYGIAPVYGAPPRP
jgi:hypothetical protein